MRTPNHAGQFVQIRASENSIDERSAAPEIRRSNIGDVAATPSQQPSRSPAILMLCYEFPPLGGGGARVVSSLTENLGEMAQPVDLVTMGVRGQQRREERAHLAIDRIPCVRTNPATCHAIEMVPYILLGLPFLLRKVRKTRYRVVHAHFIFPDGLLAWLLKKFTGLPYVITAHGSDVPGYNPDRFSFLHKLLRPVWLAVTNGSACIICPSHHLERLLLQANPSANTVVLPNGIDVARFEPRPQRDNSILVVTRIIKRKGVQYLIESLAGWENHPEVNIVGDGPYLPHLKALAARKKVRVNFLGFVDNQSPAFSTLLESARYFVFTSSAENFPIVLLEAMAAGLAIITTDDTGCVEVVGDAALLVAPANSQAIRGALERLIGDPQLTESLMIRARDRVSRHFEAGKITERHVRLYERYGRGREE